MNARRKLAIRILLWVAKALWGNGNDSVSISLYHTVTEINKTLQEMDESQENSS